MLLFIILNNGKNREGKNKVRGVGSPLRLYITGSRRKTQ